MTTGKALTEALARLLSLCLLPLPVCAQAEAESRASGSLELGPMYVSDGSYWFGQYTGLVDRGFYLDANLDMTWRDEEARSASLQGWNLGLPSRSVLFRAEEQGRFKLRILYDQLPDFVSDSAGTPFRGVGTDTLTLPPDFSLQDTLQRDLRPLDLKTERKRLGTGLSFQPSGSWKLSLAFDHETKRGTGVLGGALGGAGSNILRNTTTSLLPAAIDYTTDTVDATVAYARDKLQWELKYHLSLFSNQNDRLTWDNPFDIGYQTGRLAPAPDNQFHQLSLSGGYQLPWRSRLTAVLSTGLMLQNEQYLPSTINPDLQIGNTNPASLSALPRQSLDGKVLVNAARLRLTSRPTQALRLDASYRFDERDNQTSRDPYDYVLLDTVYAGERFLNQPTSYRKHSLGLDARYRFDKHLDLRLGYDFLAMRRSFSEVEKSDDRALSAKLSFKPWDHLRGELKAGYARRNASDYQVPEEQNPLLQKYYLADRRRRETAGAISYILPNHQLTLGFNAEYVKDQYPDSTLGLTQATRPAYGVTLTYVPREEFSVHGYYTRQDFNTEQAGSAAQGFPDWSADIQDTVDTAGIGAKYSTLQGRLELQADYVYAKTREVIDLKENSPDPGGIAPYPDLDTSLNSLQLSARYQVRKNLAWRLAYRHERFASSDWAIDGVQVNSVPNLLALGTESPNYRVNLVSGSLNYQF